MQRNNIGSGFVEDALMSLRAKDIDPAPLMRAAGLPPELTGPVSNREYGRLWWLIADVIEDEFFGLGARPMRPGSFNLMCHAVLHAGTLERALRRALLFLTVVLDDPRGSLRIRSGEAQVVLKDSTGPRQAFAYRAYWLILMGVMSWLIGRRVPLRRLDFACAAPEHRSDYRQFFGAPVSFDQPETMLVFASTHLSLPTIRNEAALRSFLREAPANILIRYRHERDTAARVRARLGAVEPDCWPDFDTIAQTMGMSPATLRRRLRADGQSFSDIRGEMRIVLAQRLLKERQLTVADIAQRLGYSETSAFHRAFLKWTGQRPGAYRDAS